MSLVPWAHAMGALSKRPVLRGRSVHSAGGGHRRAPRQRRSAVDAVHRASAHHGAVAGLRAACLPIALLPGIPLLPAAGHGLARLQGEVCACRATAPSWTHVLQGDTVFASIDGISMPPCKLHQQPRLTQSPSLSSTRSTLSRRRQVWLAHGAPPLRPFPDAAKRWLMRTTPTTDFQYAIIAGLFVGQRCNTASCRRAVAVAQVHVRVVLRCGTDTDPLCLRIAVLCF